jgi:hypothetical protein
MFCVRSEYIRNMVKIDSLIMPDILCVCINNEVQTQSILLYKSLNTSYCGLTLKYHIAII